MTRIKLIPPQHASPQLHVAYEQAMAVWPFTRKPPLIVQIVQCFAHRPALMVEIARGYYYVGWGGQLPRAVRELVAVLVSRENACVYCVTSHAAILQAASRRVEYVEQLVEGDMPPANLTPAERVVTALVHKSVVAPARLEAADLQDVVTHFGVSGSLEIVAVLSAFHVLNRMADLVGLRSDLPMPPPRWRRLRWWGIRLAGWIIRHMVDLRNQAVEIDTAAALAAAETVLGPLPAGYQAMHQAPNVAAYLLSIARVVPQLAPPLLDRVTQGVANALPTAAAEATGFHPLPADPVDALVFVGTRYAVRSTDAMVTAIRTTYGYGDPELTDLFYAIAMRNGLERMQRLLAAMPSSP